MSKALFFRQAIKVSAVLVVFSMYSCKTRKAAIPIVTGNVKPMNNNSVDSLMSKLDQHSFKAEWMSAKANVTTSDSVQETSFNITLRLRKDSVIWISVSPLLGIEVARVMITPDSIKVLDRLHGKYQTSSFEYINKLLQLKVNFEIVQALLGSFSSSARFSLCLVSELKM